MVVSTFTADAETVTVSAVSPTDHGHVHAHDFVDLEPDVPSFELLETTLSMADKL